ncbi:GNAT family N-acetyltransferase [Palleronia pelagia]|uniref:Protein N-acetyltransferase, RimJ/RimL family n=1 Tax=Palleronia pelagia TaxID=387096 RepID=A0A1H8ASI8_9RHOB|nr:GNAT family N-acetyltransferase [Palleronia pelagia]SEM73680.1 Protein N-acetyltransferase, RimJ/RimL family [Palleronia pelagia]
MSLHAHITGPTLTTERLTLRQPVMDDFGPFAAYYGSDDAGWVGGPLDDRTAYRWFSAMAGHWTLKGYGWFWVDERASGASVGFVGPHFPPHVDDMEIGWVIYPQAQGRGFGHEAAIAARDWTVKTLGPERLVSYIDPGNAPSKALARKLGATTDGTRAAHDAGCEVWQHPLEAA